MCTHAHRHTGHSCLSIVSNTNDTQESHGCGNEIRLWMGRERDNQLKLEPRMKVTKLKNNTNVEVWTGKRDINWNIKSVMFKFIDRTFIHHSVSHIVKARSKRA